MLEQSDRSSAVSQILRALTHKIDEGAISCDLNDTDAAGGDEAFEVVVARDRQTRERAYRLAQRVYQGRGYVGDAVPLNVSRFDADPETLTLLIRDRRGAEIATVTLVYDSDSGLPCDAIYVQETNALRAQGRSLVEVTRLAIDERHQRSSRLLVRLFNAIYIHARRVKGCDDFVIEVNPRHTSYYRRLLGFVEAGPCRPCERVGGAPAVLLRLDLSHPEREIRRVAGRGAAVNERSLYPYFYSWLREGVVAEMLARSQRGMEAADAAYFGLSM